MSKIIIPDKIRIMGSDYKVLRRKQERTTGEEQLTGRIMPDARIIWIDSNLPEDTQKQTFLHEIIHAALIHTGHDIPEGLTVALEYGLFQIINDNEIFK